MSLSSSVRLVRCAAPDRREAVEEQRVGLHRPLQDLGPQQDQRFLEATGIDQFGRAKSFGQVVGVGECRPGTMDRQDGDEQTCHERQHAAKRSAKHHANLGGGS